MQPQQTKTESTTPTPPRSLRTRRRRAFLMAGIAVLTVATTVIARFAASREPSAAPITASESVTVTAPLPAPVPVAQVQSPEAAKAVAENPKKTPVATTARARAHSAPTASASVVAASRDGESASKAVDTEPITSASTVESTATPNAMGVAPVTITGCLETTVDGSEFRLTDTEGIDAPKARNWRSGFLKKRAAPVQLVELSDPKGLQKYVGRRVVATGQLTSTELRVRSLLPAGSACRMN